MAASSRSSQYLNDYLNERAERVNNLQAEVNRLQAENQVLHVKLAEEKTKNAQNEASMKAMKVCLNSLIDTAATSMRTSDGFDTEVTAVSLLLVAIPYPTVRGRSF